jgi:hypothetical protein
VRELEDDLKRRTRGLYIVKSRGMPHSNEVKKLLLSNKGIHLAPIERNYITDIPLNFQEKAIIRKTQKKNKK